MAFEQSIAEKKFWNTPELIERLISSLDPASALRLLQSSVMDKDILQKSLSFKAWNNLINHKGLLQEEDVRVLVKILKFLELGEPGAFLLPLLDLICESRPSYQGLFSRGEMVEMLCPCHPEDPHSITDEAFMLLEEVEGAFRTMEQSIRSITVWELQEPLLSALSSRVVCQRQPLASIDCFYVVCKSSAEALTTLLQAERVKIKFLDFGGALGEENLHTLARALQGKPNVMLGWVYISQQDLTESSRDDIKDVWDTTGEAIGVFNTENGAFNSEKGSVRVGKSKYDWEHAWKRLKQISDMAEDEFNAECDKAWEEDSEEDADIEGEEEESGDQEHDANEGENDEEEESEDQENDGEERDEEEG